MNVVVVESPAKAKAINKYLGSDYVVLASYGHVRDLPAKNGSVQPQQDFAMVYETDPDANKHLSAIAKALKRSKRLILATDPDREGEAISWHVLEALRQEHGLGDIDVKRVVFNEITKSAVLEAMRHPRDLDMDLVNAQQARRALDYLVGFTLSPVLWRKLPGARSAGRVQSVALRLVCQRELEIEAFKPQEYWTVEADFLTGAGDGIRARLVTLDGGKLEKFSLPNEAAAEAAVAAIMAQSYAVASVETRPAKRHPQPPFTTSTLQQEASRKLGFAAKRTMQIAQRLYEGVEIEGENVGMITYMRTDGVQMANEAVAACRQVIAHEFGQDYVPDAPRVYKAKAKNAQEAHEAIRPTSLARLPAQVVPYLDRDQARLYELVWKRALASQMESARLLRTTIDIASADRRVGFRATGTVVEFPGFLKLYEEGRDDRAGSAEAEGEDGRRLPRVAEGEALRRGEVTPAQHFTEPPPRFTEATLVKQLEELGIGRPSTYAQILSVLQERSYVRLEKSRFMPEDKGLLVTAFLETYFSRYVEYGFTADLEEKLDEISAGRTDWKEVLRDFWRDFIAAVDGTTELKVRDVIAAVEELLAPHLYPQDGAGRLCPACGNGQLNLRLGRHGAFLGCANYPDCRYTRAFVGANDNGDDITGVENGPVLLGDDPESGLPVTLRKGPYGLYLQLGEAVAKGEKPKRASLPKDVAPDGLSLELALRLLALPREVGLHPETGKPITAGIGRYGPFLAHEGRYTRLEGTTEVLDIGLNRAVTLLAEAAAKGGARRGGATELRNLGPHPEDGGPVTVMDGRYGPYVKHGKLNATLPKDREPETVTMEEAVELLKQRAAKGGGKRGRKASSGTGTAKAKSKAPASKKSAPKARTGKARKTPTKAAAE